MEEKEIPIEVQKAFEWHLKQFNKTYIKFLGTINSVDYFILQYLIECEVGFPIIVSFDGKIIKKFDGFKALSVLRLFHKD